MFPALQPTFFRSKKLLFCCLDGSENIRSYPGHMNRWNKYGYSKVLNAGMVGTHSITITLAFSCAHPFKIPIIINQNQAIWQNMASPSPKTCWGWFKLGSPPLSLEFPENRPLLTCAFALHPICLILSCHLSKCSIIEHDQSYYTNQIKVKLKLIRKLGCSFPLSSQYVVLCSA